MSENLLARRDRAPEGREDGFGRESTPDLTAEVTADVTAGAETLVENVAEADAQALAEPGSDRATDRAPDGATDKAPDDAQNPAPDDPVVDPAVDRTGGNGEVEAPELPGAESTAKGSAKEPDKGSHETPDERTRGKRTRVVRIGKCRLVTNVFWTGIVSDHGTPYTRSELARAARARGHDALVLARLRAGSLALPETERKGCLCPRRNCLSLAVLMTGLLARGVLVLRLTDEDNGPFWWVWAARSAVVSARADSCHARLDEARELATAIAQSLGTGAPRVLEERESRALVERAFLEAPRELRREAALLPLEPLSTGRLVAAGTLIVLAAGLLVAGKTLWQTWETKSRNAILFETRAELERKAAHIRAHPEEHFDVSWQTRLPARDAADILLGVMLEHPMAGNGWQLVSLVASEKTLSARWKALPAASLLVLPEGAATDAKNPEEASRTTPLALPESSGRLAKEELLAKDEAGVRLAEIARRLGSSFKLSFRKPESVTVGEMRVEAPWVQGLAQFGNMPEFAVSDRTSLAKALELPGLFVRDMTWNGKQWSMTLDVVTKR